MAPRQTLNRFDFESHSVSASPNKILDQATPRLLFRGKKDLSLKRISLANSS
ncbi:hypothetical protein GGP55_002645 [Salinibacter ruber]|nr:hypothetical protein [Salinibacter ruber]